MLFTRTACTCASLKKRKAADRATEILQFGHVLSTNTATTVPEPSTVPKPCSDSVRPFGPALLLVRAPPPTALLRGFDPAAGAEDARTAGAG